MKKKIDANNAVSILLALTNSRSVILGCLYLQ